MTTRAIDRRTLLKASASGLAAGLLTFSVGGAPVMMTAREARAEGLPFAVLDAKEARALEALGEALAHGAADAGIAHYVDSQLAADADDCLLMIRYLDVSPPWAGFYKSGLAALDGLAEARFGALFADLAEDRMLALVGEISGAQPENWAAPAPPAPFFYFVVRGDAVDVAYGTREGFERLGIDYLGHVMPETSW